MKKTLLSFILFLAAGLGMTKANPLPDEGMWLPLFVERLNYTDMQKMGLQLTPEEIYSINNSSLKDAIVGLSHGAKPRGFFCSGEIVSGKGLMFTNHHCGYDAIQNHSTVEHDYLKDGFWAYKMNEELANEGLSASFLQRIENVTDSIVPHLNADMTEEERAEKINEIKTRLEKSASTDGKLNPVVKGFFGGNEFYMFVYKTYTDVRLVGAPPSSVGKFGGDTDNWMWPRHTGDFSIFRVYADANGEPANYSKENKPYQPKWHLPVSLNGVEKDDYAMIWGYPGSTDRYLTSYGVESNINKKNPVVIDAFGAKLAAWKKAMDADPAVRIQYASKYASTANSWKYLIGQSKGLKRLKIYDKKLGIENKFRKWVAADPERQKMYGEALNLIEEGYKTQDKALAELYFASLCGLNGTELTAYAQEFAGLAQLLKKKKKDKEKIAKTAEAISKNKDEHFKEYSLVADKNVMAALLKVYTQNIKSSKQPEYLVEMAKKFKNDWNAYTEYVFEKSNFTTPEKVDKLLAKPSLKKIEKDPAYQLMQAFYNKVISVVGPYRSASPKIEKGNRLFIAGLRKMEPAKKFYPNANSTMRVTYGSVQDYYPADAVHYDFITTTQGILEKEDKDNPEFVVPGKLVDLINNKDYGQYADENGELVTCFLTTNDITGGNSGSGVINGRGELIGIAFDGNWEAMSGDIAFEPELQRTICVDARYVLFIIDKYAGAKNLIEEMTIIKGEPKGEAAEIEAAEIEE
ncbi:MAG: S46 family peptidase [Bacteroidales bacterium]